MFTVRRFTTTNLFLIKRSLYPGQSQQSPLAQTSRVRAIFASLKKKTAYIGRRGCFASHETADNTELLSQLFSPLRPTFSPPFRRTAIPFSLSRTLHLFRPRVFPTLITIHISPLAVLRGNLHGRRRKYFMWRRRSGSGFPTGKRAQARKRNLVPKLHLKTAGIRDRNAGNF